MTVVTRRPAAEDDAALLFELYASTRAEELAQVPWSEEQKLAFTRMQFEAQTASYRGTYPSGLHEVLCVDGVPVGRIYWVRLPDSIHILDITVAPARRGEGIGGRAIGEILDEASRTGKKVTIYLEDFNPSRHLFDRLGFRIVKQDSFMLFLERPAISGVAGAE